MIATLTRASERPGSVSLLRGFGVYAGWAILSLVIPANATADIVRLTNGRTMTVDSCVFDGDSVIFKMPNGGEIKAPRSLLDEILPDEIPFARVVAIEALAASPSATRPQLGPDALRALVDAVAARVGLDRKLAHAVVSIESNYDPRAISPKGAMGLMQLMPSVARDYELADPFDPEKNLEAGMKHLRSLLARFDPSRALAAYNAGIGAVTKYGRVPPYRETQDYVRRILALVK
jgi:transglycosylase-like protein with SLT domain